MSDEKCGCCVTPPYRLRSSQMSPTIRYCPLHEAARKLMEACEIARAYLSSSSYGGLRISLAIALDVTNDAIAAAKEGQCSTLRDGIG